MSNWEDFRDHLVHPNRRGSGPLLFPLFLRHWDRQDRSRDLFPVFPGYSRLSIHRRKVFLHEFFRYCSIRWCWVVIVSNKKIKEIEKSLPSPSFILKMYRCHQYKYYTKCQPRVVFLVVLFGLVRQSGLESTSRDYMRGRNGFAGNKQNQGERRRKRSNTNTQKPAGSFLL